MNVKFTEPGEGVSPKDSLILKGVDEALLGAGLINWGVRVVASKVTFVKGEEVNIAEFETLLKEAVMEYVPSINVVVVEVKVLELAVKLEVNVNVPGDVEFEIIFNTTRAGLRVKQGPSVQVNDTFTDPLVGVSDKEYLIPIAST